MTAGVGQRIKLRREERGITGAELARRAGISKGYLSEIENGQASRPSADVLHRIATALETTVADLLGRRAPARAAPRQIPASLREFAADADLTDDDLRMLAGIKFRGQQPASAEDWRFLYEAIRRSVRDG